MIVVEKEEPKEFRYGVPEDVYSEWRAMQRRVGLPQTQILHRLVKFLLAQEQITQAMLLGTVDARDDLIEFVLQSRAGKRPAPRSQSSAAGIAVTGGSRSRMSDGPKAESGKK